MTAPMSLLRRQRGMPGPPRTPAGAPAGGVPFLVNELGDPSARLMVEAAFGADVTSAEPQMWNWYDITTDVRQADGNKVTISPVGRSDETSQAQPAGCGFQLDNTSGAYTANHPGSRWFPYVRRNTPIRVRLYINGVWFTRFEGYANGWVPSWDISCNLAVVSVSASGVSRRLNQGKSPLRSALYRAIIDSGPIAYWPFEDGKYATTPSNAIAGSTSLVFLNDPSQPSQPNPIKFASQSGPPGSADLIQSSANGISLTGGIPAASATSWRVDYVAKTTATLAGDPTEIDVQLFSSGDLPYWEFVMHNVADGGFRVNVGPNYNSLGIALHNTGLACADGNWHYISVRAAQNGPDILVTTYVDTNSFAFTISGKTLQPLSLIWDLAVEVNDTVSLGHLTFWQPSSNVNIYNPSIGWSGESATARLSRLCSEHNIPITINGTSDTAMGPQGVDTITNLLRECEAADDGLLYDGFGAGLGYITRQSRYNAATSLSPDMAVDPPQVGDPFTPTDDDQRNRNLVKVDRKNGSSNTIQDETGSLGTNTIQIYDSSVTVNTNDDSGLTYRAAWEVRKGTVPGFRYPTLNLDLAATPALVAGWLSTNLAGRIDVLNVSSKATQHPPGTVSLLLEGYSEILSPFDWQVIANCSPYAPWRVAVIEGTGDTAWRIDSGGSTVAADALAGATSLSVAITDGYLWSTSAGDYPRDIDVGGAQVTATAVSGVSSPQTFTITPVTYPLKVGWSVSLWRPPMIAL